MKLKLDCDALCRSLENLPAKSGCTSIHTCAPLERQILRPVQSGANIDWEGMDMAGIRLTDIDRLEEGISDIFHCIHDAKRMYNKFARQKCSADTERRFC